MSEARAGTNSITQALFRHPRAALLLLTLTGIFVGVAADFASEVTYDPLNNISLQSVPLAVLLSPVVVPCCGRAVRWLPELFLFGGLLFWPVWGVLAWRWLSKQRSVGLATVIVVWSAQGFFQILHRLAMMLSV